MARNGYYNFWVGFLIVSWSCVVFSIIVGVRASHFAVQPQLSIQPTLENYLLARIAADSASLLAAFFAFWSYVGLVGVFVCHLARHQRVEMTAERERVFRTNARLQRAGGLDVDLRA